MTMAVRIAYLLHRFPRKTDTFIQREIAALRRRSLDVEVISVWHPSVQDTNAETLNAWKSVTTYILPSPKLRLLGRLFLTILKNPAAFLRTLLLAARTSKPGVKGAALQSVYLAEAIEAGRILKQRHISHVHNHIGDQSGTVTMLAAHLPESRTA